MKKALQPVNICQVNYQGVFVFFFCVWNKLHSDPITVCTYIERVCMYIEMLKATELLNVNNSCFPLCFFSSWPSQDVFLFSQPAEQAVCVYFEIYIAYIKLPRDVCIHCRCYTLSSFFQNYQLSVFHDPFDAMWFYSIFLVYNAFSWDKLIPDVFQWLVLFTS